MSKKQEETTSSEGSAKFTRLARPAATPGLQLYHLLPGFEPIRGIKSAVMDIKRSGDGKGIYGRHSRQKPLPVMLWRLGGAGGRLFALRYSMAGHDKNLLAGGQYTQNLLWYHKLNVMTSGGKSSQGSYFSM